MSRSTKLIILGAFFVVCATSTLVQGWRQGSVAAPKPTDLYEVVWQQVVAFRADDFASAYRQVSSDFQERFDFDAFTDLARSDLPAIRVAERVEFGALKRDGARVVVTAYFFLPGGEVLPCLYSLVREEKGWKIDAVRVQKRWPAGRRLGGMRA